VKKGTLAVLLAVLLVPVVVGCAGLESLWDHTKWHIHGAYQDLVNIEQTLDRHVWNLDETNPDRY
jgi:hypothetical protein